MRQATERFEEFEKYLFQTNKSNCLESFLIIFFVSDENPEAEAVKWTPENWRMMKTTLADVQKNYKIYETKQELSVNKCVQKIWIEDSNLLLELPITRIDGKWKCPLNILFRTFPDHSNGFLSNNSHLCT